MSVLTVEGFDGRLVVYQSDDDIAVAYLGLTLDDYDIAAENAGVYHRVALYPQREKIARVAVARDIRDVAVQILDGEYRAAGRDGSDERNERNIGSVRSAGRGNVAAAEINEPAIGDELLELTVDIGFCTQAEVGRDIVYRRREAVPAIFLIDKIENLLAFIRSCHGVTSQEGTHYERCSLLYIHIIPHHGAMSNTEKDVPDAQRWYNKEKSQKELDSVDRIAELARRIEKARGITAFTGAGVSTESDIPDFRSAGGVYESISREYGRPPEELLSHGFFMEHTDIFYDYLRKYLIFPDAKPNLGHKTLAALEREGKLIGVVTQNIDGLHQAAGCKNVYELHGSLYRNTCLRCGKKFGLDYILAASGVPLCDSCGGKIKPDVVLYGEQLDDEVVMGAVEAIRRADMLLIMGTSLAVYPAAGLIDYFRGDDIVLINKSRTPYDGRASLVINDAAGKTLKAAADVLGLEV